MEANAKLGSSNAHADAGTSSSEEPSVPYGGGWQPPASTVMDWVKTLGPFAKFADKFEFTDWDALKSFGVEDLKEMDIPPNAAVPLSKKILGLFGLPAREAAPSGMKQTLSAPPQVQTHHQRAGGSRNGSEPASPLAFKETELDLDKIMKLIKENKLEGQHAADKAVVLVLGSTMAGKSTTINFLAGRNMKDTDLGHIECTNPLEGCRIDRNFQAVTRNIRGFPATQPFEDLILLDTPGFNDTYGMESQIANAVSIANVMKHYKKVHPVLLLNFKTFGGDRAQVALELSRLISAWFFPVQSYFPNHLSVFFTRIEPESNWEGCLRDVLQNAKNHPYHEQEKLTKQEADALKYFWETLYQQFQDRKGDSIVFPTRRKPQDYLALITKAPFITGDKKLSSVPLSPDNQHSLVQRCKSLSEDCGVDVLDSRFTEVQSKLDTLLEFWRSTEIPLLKVYYDEVRDQIAKEFKDKLDVVCKRLDACNYEIKAELKALDGMAALSQHIKLENPARRDLTDHALKIGERATAQNQAMPSVVIELDRLQEIDLKLKEFLTGSASSEYSRCLQCVFGRLQKTYDQAIATMTDLEKRDFPIYLERKDGSEEEKGSVLASTAENMFKPVNLLADVREGTFDLEAADKCMNKLAAALSELQELSKMDKHKAKLQKLSEMDKHMQTKPPVTHQQTGYKKFIPFFNGLAEMLSPTEALAEMLFPTEARRPVSNCDLDSIADPMLWYDQIVLRLATTLETCSARVSEVQANAKFQVEKPDILVKDCFLLGCIDRQPEIARHVDEKIREKYQRALVSLTTRASSELQGLRDNLFGRVLVGNPEEKSMEQNLHKRLSVGALNPNPFLDVGVSIKAISAVACCEQNKQLGAELISLLREFINALQRLSEEGKQHWQQVSWISQGGTKDFQELQEPYSNAEDFKKLERSLQCVLLAHHALKHFLCDSKVVRVHLFKPMMSLLIADLRNLLTDIGRSIGEGGYARAARISDSMVHRKPLFVHFGKDNMGKHVCSNFWAIVRQQIDRTRWIRRNAISDQTLEYYVMKDAETWLDSEGASAATDSAVGLDAIPPKESDSSKTDATRPVVARDGDLLNTREATRLELLQQMQKVGADGKVLPRSALVKRGDQLHYVYLSLQQLNHLITKVIKGNAAPNPPTDAQPLVKDVEVAISDLCVFLDEHILKQEKVLEAQIESNAFGEAFEGLYGLAALEWWEKYCSYAPASQAQGAALTPVKKARKVLQERFRDRVDQLLSDAKQALHASDYPKCERVLSLLTNATPLDRELRQGSLAKQVEPLMLEMETKKNKLPEEIKLCLESNNFARVRDILEPLKRAADLSEFYKLNKVICTFFANQLSDLPTLSRLFPTENERADDEDIIRHATDLLSRFRNVLVLKDTLDGYNLPFAMSKLANRVDDAFDDRAKSFAFRMSKYHYKKAVPIYRELQVFQRFDEFWPGQKEPQVSSTPMRVDKSSNDSSAQPGYVHSAGKKNKKKPPSINPGDIKRSQHGHVGQVGRGAFTPAARDQKHSVMDPLSEKNNTPAGYFAGKLDDLQKQHFSTLEKDVKTRIQQDLEDTINPDGAGPGQLASAEEDGAGPEGQPALSRTSSQTATIFRKSLAYIDAVLENCKAVADDNSFQRCNVDFGDLGKYVQAYVEDKWKDCMRKLSKSIGDGNLDLAQSYLARADALMTCEYIKSNGQASRKWEKAHHEVKMIMTTVDFGVENAEALCQKLSILRPIDFTAHHDIAEQLDAHFTRTVATVKSYLYGDTWTTDAKLNAGAHLKALDKYVEELQRCRESKMAAKLSEEVQKLRTMLVEKLMDCVERIQHAREVQDWATSLELMAYTDVIIKSKEPLLEGETQEEWVKRIAMLKRELVAQEEQINASWDFVQGIQFRLGMLDSKFFSHLNVIKEKVGALRHNQKISYNNAIQILARLLKSAEDQTKQDLASGTNKEVKSKDPGSPRVTVYASLRFLLSNLSLLADHEHEPVDHHPELSAIALKTRTNVLLPITNKLKTSKDRALALCKANKFKDLELIWADLRDLETELKEFSALFTEMPVESLVRELKADIKKTFDELQRGKDWKIPELLATFLIETKKRYSEISQVEVEQCADKSITELLEKCSKSGVDFYQLARYLNEDPVGEDMVFNGAYPQFQAEKDKKIKELQSKAGITIDSAIDKLQKANSDVDEKSWTQLRKCYDDYKVAYDENVKKFLLSEQSLKQDLLVKLVKRSADEVTSLRQYDDDARKKLSILLAHMFALWTVSSSIGYAAKQGDEKSRDQYIKSPNVVQVLVIMRLLGLDNLTTEHNWWSRLTQRVSGATWTKTIENHLAEVETGGGKSIVLGALASLLALLQCRVDVACYSERLVERDRKDCEAFWRLLGISELVQYSTLKGLANQILKEEQGDVRALTKAFLTSDDGLLVDVKQASAAAKDWTVQYRPRVLLIDEVDVFFQKDFYGKSYDAATLIKSQEITDLFEHIWSQRKALPTLEQVTHLQVYLDVVNRFPNLESLLPLAANSMLRDVNHFNLPNYVIAEVKHGKKAVGYPDFGGVSTSIVHGYKTAFANIHARENKEITPEAAAEKIGLSIPCGNFSFAEVPGLFQCILGVTGTLSTMQDFEKEVLTEFKINKSTLAPSIYPPSKVFFDKQKHVICEQDRDTFYGKLDHAINKVRGKRPCLIFFYSDEALQKFEGTDYYKRTPNISTLTGTAHNFNFDLRKSMKVESVTCLPAVLGRGIDFKCDSDEAEKNGGVHVIQAFFSMDASEERQIKGRTARQSKSGSYEIITCVEDLKALDLTADQITSAGSNLYDVLDAARKAHAKKLVDQRRLQVRDAKSVDQASKKFLKGLTKRVGMLKQRDQDSDDEILSFLKTARSSSGSSEGVYHWVFAIDISGSMGTSDITPKDTKTFRQDRLGAVCEQVWSFIVARAAMANRYSLVAFDDTSQVVFSGEKFSQDLGEYFCVLAPRNNTDFSKPFQEITKLLATPGIKGFKDQITGTKILFLSDGEGGDPGQVVETMMQKYPGIRIRTLKFGTDQSGNDVLKSIAKRGKDVFIDIWADALKANKRNLDGNEVYKALDAFATEPMELY
eukprot:g14014.t1